MLKDANSLKELESTAANAMREALKPVSSIEIERLEVSPRGFDGGIDVLVKVSVGGHEHLLACEVKSSGQPRYLRNAILQLREYITNRENISPVFIAPYLSADAQRLCKESEINFLDLEGNCLLQFDNVYIERQIGHRSAAEKRALRSIFKPKAAAILRVMMREPDRAWRVADLAFRADASLGQVSNVRNALLDREWAKSELEGLRLTNTVELINAWREEYEQPKHQEHLYTSMHGQRLDGAIRQSFEELNTRGKIVLGSFSAARWLAPHLKIANDFFYVDEDGRQILKRNLELKPASQGGNVTLVRPKDEGIFQDTTSPVPGLFCTSPIQTYLDLWVSGERGREAADHLRRELLVWQK